MLRALLLFAIYLLVLVNLVLGFVVFVQAHRFTMLLTDVLRRGGQLDNVGLFAAAQGSVSSFTAILLGLAGMVLFPALEHYYTAAKSKAILLSRFLRVVGIELITIATVQLVSFVLVSVYAGAAVPTFPLLVTLLALFAGCFLIIYQTVKPSV